MTQEEEHIGTVAVAADTPTPSDQSAENIFGKMPGRFDEAAAATAQRSIEQALISSFFALPPERIGAAVAAFNEAHKPRCGRPGWMIVSTGGAAIAATVTPPPVDHVMGKPLGVTGRFAGEIRQEFDDLLDARNGLAVFTAEREEPLPASQPLNDDPIFGASLCGLFGLSWGRG